MTVDGVEEAEDVKEDEDVDWDVVDVMVVKDPLARVDVEVMMDSGETLEESEVGEIVVT